MSVVPPNHDSHHIRTAEGALRPRVARIPIVGLFGGATKLAPERAALARELGILVAHVGAHLLTASSYAVNEAAANGFASVDDRCGVCIGNVPRGVDGALGQASSGDGTSIKNVELAIFTTVQDVQSCAGASWQQKLNLLTSNAILVLPGHEWIPNDLRAPAAHNGGAQGNGARRPTILVGPPEEFAPELRGIFLHGPTVAAAAAHLCRILENQRLGLKSASLA